MPTVQNCVNPKEGWELYAQLFKDFFSIIGLQRENEDKIKNEEKAERERVVLDNLASLIGNLYVVAYRMRIHRHREDAEKMQATIDMAVDMDFFDPAARERVKKMLSEFERKIRADNATGLDN